MRSRRSYLRWTCSRPCDAALKGGRATLKELGILRIVGRLGEEMAKNIQARNQVTATGPEGLGPEELKSLVRDGLVAMNMAERESFFEVLDREMKSVGLDIRKYLVPLGIPGRSPEDLTPTEVGHIVRFLKFNEPKAMPAVGKALSRFTVFGEKVQSGRKLAA